MSLFTGRQVVELEQAGHGYRRWLRLRSCAVLTGSPTVATSMPPNNSLKPCEITRTFD